MNPDALREFHVTVRDMDVWSFDKAMRAMFGPEKGIEQMWAEYQQFCRARRRRPDTRMARYSKTRLHGASFYMV